MTRKMVFLAADSLEIIRSFKAVLDLLDVEVLAVPTAKLRRALQLHEECDLVIYEATAASNEQVSTLENLLSEYGSRPVLFITSVSHLQEFRLPIKVKSDFVIMGATAEECSARIRNLIWPGNETASSDFITIDDMTVNLATYQVCVNGVPVDFTYLEYALLAFLVTHPGRTYSRDMLLRRVWGFDYYGGSRTVDVHVRRVRAKLGPELAQHLETVRGVGYLWNM